MERSGISFTVSGLRAAVVAASAAGLMLLSAAMGLGQDQSHPRQGYLPPPGPEYPQPPAGARPPIQYDPSGLTFRSRDALDIRAYEVPPPAEEEETVREAVTDAYETAEKPWRPSWEDQLNRSGQGF
jgi:hypothetical protein